MKYISYDFHKKISSPTLVPGDVVIVRTGNPGTCAIIPERMKSANCSDLVLWGREISNKFLSYYINSVAQSHINAHLVGHAATLQCWFSKRNKNPITKFSEQKAIIHDTWALDNKIN